MDRYYWLKLQKDFFKRHDIQIVESMPNGKDYILFYLIADRKERRKPMTERAVKLFLGRLDGWPVTEQKRAINEAIVKGWASVFPKKEKEKRKNESVYTSDASYDLNDFAKRAIGLEGLQ